MSETIERRRLTQEEVDAILDEHYKHYDGYRVADLSNTELIGISFECDVRSVNFDGSSFNNCIFYKRVYNSSFKYAEMTNVQFCGDINETSFSKAHFIECEYAHLVCSLCCFYESKISNTEFRYCRFTHDDFRQSEIYNIYFMDGTLLVKCNFNNSTLDAVNFGAIHIINSTFSGCDLSKVVSSEITAFYALSCPEEGSFIGFKKCGEYIVKLEICEDALRSSGASRKCRCSKAKVLSITTLDGEDAGITEVSSDYDYDFVYRVGEIVEVLDFDTDRWNTCTTGIHFFITRNEAVNY